MLLKGGVFSSRHTCISVNMDKNVSYFTVNADCSFCSQPRQPHAMESQVEPMTDNFINLAPWAESMVLFYITYCASMTTKVSMDMMRLNQFPTYKNASTINLSGVMHLTKEAITTLIVTGYRVCWTLPTIGEIPNLTIVNPHVPDPSKKRPHNFGEDEGQPSKQKCRLVR